MRRILLLLVIVAIGVTLGLAQSQVKKEASELGAISQTMKIFALDYIQTHKK